MTKITNKVGSPFDVQTLNGPAVLPAFGSLEANFDSGYLNVLLMGGHIIEEAPEEVETQAEELDLSSLRAEYLDLAGKDADKRWSEKRIVTEISQLKETK